MQIINKLVRRLAIGTPSTMINSLNKTKITWGDIKNSKNLFYKGER